MKKFFGLIFMSLMLFVPFSVFADVRILTDASGNAATCSDNEDGTRTCVVVIQDDGGHESLTVYLTPQGGAEITAIEDADDSDWTIESGKTPNADGTYTVVLSSPGSSNGEVDLFKFTYRKSGTTDCRVNVSLQNSGTTTPTTPTTPTEETKNCKIDNGKYYDKDGNEVTKEEYDKICGTATENKTTGSTLPYIALATIGVISVAAYITVKNKSKMYRI